MTTHSSPKPPLLTQPTNQHRWALSSNNAGDFLTGTVKKIQLFHSYVCVCLDTLSARAKDPLFQERIHRRVTYPLLLLKFTSHHLLNSFNSLLLSRGAPSSPAPSSSPSSPPSSSPPQIFAQASVLSEMAKFLRLLRSNWTQQTILKAIQLTPLLARDTAQLLFSLAEELIARLALTTDLLSTKFGTKSFPPSSKL